jgi:hypothetical protein
MKATLARVLAVALPCLLLGQAAILQVRVVAGEGAVHAPGSRTTRELAVEVTDETGRPVQGAAVSFRLPEQGPGGLFSNGLTTDLVLTGADGRASVKGIRLNRIAGPFQVRITVAKDQARAGLVSRQYVSEMPPASGSAPAEVKKGRGKWIAVALLAAGAAGGAVFGLTRNRTSDSTASPPPSVGPPAISIGKP